MISNNTFSPFIAPSPNSEFATVLMVEDHVAVLGMMLQVVRSRPRFAVTHEAHNAADALAIAIREPIDVAVVDVGLPDVSGMAFLEQLKEVRPKTKVLVFSGNLTAAMLRDLIAMGVLGVVAKTSPLDVFVAALESVADGRVYFDSTSGQLIKTLMSDHGAGRAVETISLSPREKSVLAYLAQGLSSKEIAATLGLSVHTIVNHRSNLMKKTGLRRVAQLSLYAERIGLVSD
jgi:DNA-binding NarL/FixJ family response regulator